LLEILNISVIIPVYNAAPFLDKSIQSALDQLQTKEVLLIDDRSADNSFEICKKWERNDSRVKVFINEGTKGAGAARNVGLRNATCEYIAFLDADDYYLQGRFTSTENIFYENPLIDAIGEGVLVSDSNNSNQKIIVSYDKPKNKVNLKHFLTKSPFYITGLTIKKKCLKLVGYFDEKLMQTQDTDFILRLIFNCNVFSGNKDEIVSIYLIHHSNTTKIITQRNFHRRNYFKKYIPISIFEFRNISLIKFFIIRYLYYDFLVRSNSPEKFNKFDRLKYLPISLLYLFKK